MRISCVKIRCVNSPWECVFTLQIHSNFFSNWKIHSVHPNEFGSATYAWIYPPVRWRGQLQKCMQQTCPIWTRPKAGSTWGQNFLLVFCCVKSLQHVSQTFIISSTCLLLYSTADFTCASSRQLFCHVWMRPNAAALHSYVLHFRPNSAKKCNHSLLPPNYYYAMS